MGMLPPNLRLDLDALRVDVAAAALRDVVKDGWSVLALSTGMADALTDQAGIASLGGATYDGTAKTVSNPGSYTLVSSGGAAIANNNNGASYAQSYAFDGNTATTWVSGDNPTVVGTTYIGYDFGVGVTRHIRRIAINQHNAEGALTATGYLTSVKVQYSDNGSSWADVATVTLAGGTNDETVDLPASSAHRYWRLLANSASSTAQIWGVDEIRMYEGGVSPAVTAVSNAFALSFQPAQARIVAPMELGSGVLGTDGLLDLSRDGATWAAVPLADLGKFDANTRIVGGLVDLSGQPAGSSIYWRWRTTAGIAQALHGVWVQCK